MLWASNATVTDRKGLTARARFTATPLQLANGLPSTKGQISFEDEAGSFDFDGNLLLDGDDGTRLVVGVPGLIAFCAGANQTFEFHRVREPKPGDRWPEPGD